MLKTFENKSSLDKYISKLPPFIIYDLNNATRCHICGQNDCEMKIQCMFCKSDLCNKKSNTPICPCKYKIEMCNKRQTIYFSKAFDHLHKYSMRKASSRPYGMSAQAKEITEQIIFYHGITKPTHIQSKMNEKFKNFIDIVPTIRQIQNYVKTRRKRSNLKDAASQG